MKKIHIGIIGWGPVSRYCHYKAIKKNPDLELIAICDKNKNLINKANVSKNTLKYTNYKTMIKQNKFDFIILACSFKNLFEVSKYLIDKKINLLAEKPMCISFQQSNFLYKLSKKKKVKYMVGFMKIFDPVVNILKKNIDLKNIKHIKYYSLSGKAFREKFKSKKNKFNFTNGINTKIRNRTSYLKFIFTHSHAINLLNFLIGEFKLNKQKSKKNHYFFKKGKLNIELICGYKYSEKWNEKLILAYKNEKKIIKFAPPNIQGRTSNFYSEFSNGVKKNYKVGKNYSFKAQIHYMIDLIKFNKRNFNISKNVYKYFKIYEKIFTS